MKSVNEHQWWWKWLDHFHSVEPPEPSSAISFHMNCLACYEAGNIYEFDLIANNNPQNNMHTNTNTGQWDKGKRAEKETGCGGENSMVEEKKDNRGKEIPLSTLMAENNITSFLQREEKLLLVLWCSLAFSYHRKQASKWTGKSQYETPSKPHSKTQTERLDLTERNRKVYFKTHN